MLSQNFKGLLTLVFIFSFLVGGFYLYKNVFEPSVINKNSLEQFPLTTDVEITPKIDITDTKITVTWDTPIEVKGAILYCIKSNLKDCKEVSDPSATKNHKIEVTQLLPATEYSYKLLIDNTYYPSDEKTYFNFVTKKDSATSVTTSPSPSTIKSPLTKDSNKIPTNTPTQVTQSTTKKVTLFEFKAAMDKQDLKYDTDKNGKVTIEDYKP